MADNNTPPRAVRVDDETWMAAKARARAERRPLSEVIRVALRAYAEGRYHATEPKGSTSMTVKNTSPQYFHSATTGALLRRLGGADRVYMDGIWKPTETIVEYMSGQEDNVEPIGEAEAKKIAPDAF